MKIQYRHQKFQADAARAVVDVFAGQPYLTPTYMMDRGSGNYQIGVNEERDFTGFSNQRIVLELSDQRILEQMNKIQRANQLKPSDKLEGREGGYNLTIEMETGVGKTYTYIKTMFELNKHYGWSKFIVVVPSVAIREGVYKAFEMTQEHFAEEYGKKIRFFIYNSAQLTEIDHFASDSSINVMIINSQAFNAKGKDARRIYMKLDEFRSRRPIDIIAKTNPILIIDEPQSVEGKQTKERLKEFHPLLTLRYSATHKSDSIYNMVFRLDAMEAYNRRLVKKIAVKGITESGSSAADSYLYLESINLSKSDPTATLQFEVKMASGVPKKKSRIVKFEITFMTTPVVWKNIETALWSSRSMDEMTRWSSSTVSRFFPGMSLESWTRTRCGVSRYEKPSSPTSSGSASCFTRALRCFPCSSLTKWQTTGNMMPQASRSTANTPPYLRRNTRMS